MTCGAGGSTMNNELKDIYAALDRIGDELAAIRRHLSDNNRASSEFYLLGCEIVDAVRGLQDNAQK
jgi:hypothetical protein